MPESPALRIDIIVRHAAWKPPARILRPQLRSALRATLSHAAPPNVSEAGQAFELCLLLEDDAAVRTLNAQYRGKDKPTNVLSFPQTDFTAPLPAPETGPLPLGDIVMAYETVARESAAQGKAFEDHCLHLAVHGILHLLGYDHESEAEAAVMESLEIEILGRIGIENPYASMHPVR